MKILFIENRYKTTLWELIGKEFEKQGHEIYFMVQNHSFKPAIGEVTVLPYYKNQAVEKNYTPEIKKVIQSNRGLNYFGITSDNFVFYYDKIIDKTIDKINPDFVFGESTLFHELLVINACKKRDILYLHPSTCRYPSARFSFYLYDTLKPYGVSNESFSEEEALATVKAIEQRKALPDYMLVKKSPITKKEQLLDKLKLTKAYYSGEKFNTPSPFKKKEINSISAKNIAEWERMAVGVDNLDTKDFLVMYAMQMQPEANIDVWGYPFNNQAKVVEAIVKELQDGEKLVLKPNPKSKYEISQDLINSINTYKDKIIVLQHTSKMDQVWPKIDLVVTVTGTVSLECVFSNKPVIVLGQGIQTSQKNCFTSLNQMREAVSLIQQNVFPKLNNQEKVKFLNTLVQTSFKGINGDGLHNLAYLKDKENFDCLVNAFVNIIQSK